MTTFGIFDHVPPQERDRVLGAARRRRFEKHEVIFHEGDPADALHLIVRGRCAVRVCTHTGEVTTLTVLKPGEIFGELALLEIGGVRTADVITLEPCETLAIHRADFDRLRHEYPEVGDVLLTILAHRIIELSHRLTEALYVPADKRVIRRLLELADIYDEGNGACVVRIAQDDLGGLAGASRATVNRVLRLEERRGTVRLHRGSTTILDREKLEQRAD